MRVYVVTVVVVVAVVVVVVAVVVIVVVLAVVVVVVTDVGDDEDDDEHHNAEDEDNEHEDKDDDDDDDGDDDNDDNDDDDSQKLNWNNNSILSVSWDKFDDPVRLPLKTTCLKRPFIVQDDVSSQTEAVIEVSTLPFVELFFEIFSGIGKQTIKSSDLAIG